LKADELPSCGNIDTDAHWGVSGAGQWVYGYRLHSLMSCGPYGLDLPCDAQVEPANVKDADVFKRAFVPSLPESALVILADTGYDDQGCYEASDAKNISLLAPIKVKKNTPARTAGKSRAFLRS
jgi:hypothetical protein